MLLLLTTVLPLLAHNHASAVAFLTCCYHNFHGSIIPEFLSDEDRVKSFYEARQQNQLFANEETQYTNLYSLFVQTPLMQFSPSLSLCQKDCAESILKSLLATKYFTRTLQRCSVCLTLKINNDLLQCLSKVRSLTKLDLGWEAVENEHLKIIVNSFPSLETLNIPNAAAKFVNNIVNPHAPTTKTLRSLTMLFIDGSFATQFVPHFNNLRKLELSGPSPLHQLRSFGVKSRIR